MTEYKKVKNPNKIGNIKPKTEKQLKASRESGLKVMLTKNPMYNPKSVEKLRLKNIGRKRPDLTLRNIKNNPIKNPEVLKKHTQNKIGRKNEKLSMQRNGKPLKHLKDYQVTTKSMILNNPMRNKDIAKKQHLNDKRNKKFIRRCKKNEEINIPTVIPFNPAVITN